VLLLLYYWSKISSALGQAVDPFAVIESAISSLVVAGQDSMEEVVKEVQEGEEEAVEEEAGEDEEAAEKDEEEKKNE